MTPYLASIRSLAALTLVALAHGAATAQTDSSAGAVSRSVRDSVYTAAQADRGEARFRAICAECHVATQFAGAAFLHSWGGRPAFDLFDLVRRTMPYDNPGGLGRDASAEVLAFILRMNGFPAGDRELPSDDATLKRIKMEPPEGGR